MNRLLPILANGTVIGLTLTLLAVLKRSLWPLSPLLIVAALAVNRASLHECARLPDGLRRGLPRAAASIVLGFMTVFLVRQFAQNLWLYGLQVGAAYALDVLLKNVSLILVLTVVFWRSRTVDLMGAMVALVLGVALFSGLNLVADRLGILMATDVIFGESRFQGLADRWLPPLTRSNASFSMACTVYAVMALLLLARGFGQVWRRPVWVVLLMASVGVMGLSAVKCQFRAQFIVPTVGLLWVLLPRKKGRSLVAWGALSVMLAFPTLFIGPHGYDFVEWIAPDRVLNAIGSTTEGANTLSDRTLLYEYGWSQLATWVGVVGEGPVLRDATPAVAGVSQSTRLPYHSGVLDILVPHGLPLGLLVLAGLVLTLGGLVARCHRNTSAASRLLLELSLVNLVLWFAMSTMDGGMGSYFENFCLALIPALAGFRYLGQSDTAQREPLGRITIPAPVNPATTG